MEDEYYSYIKKFFRRWASVYDILDIFISGLMNKVVEFTDAGNGSRVLDVATGTGKQAFAFARKGYDVVGIDLSTDMLNVAMRKARYVM
ncbi:MAG: hypothetical protein B6U72_02370 [Candidatus Altiarchaeales archaeon ex4484_2]|nr:MAG: hypothetical protein B6U72_02370 [Candidatus Altiarchaeales archaeon ex4484_2]